MSNIIENSILQAIRNRNGLLWICQRYDLLPNQEPHDYSLPPAEATLRYRSQVTKADVNLASLYWEAIWLEGAMSPVFQAVKETYDGTSSSQRRAIVTLAGTPDAKAEVSSEFLPICVLPGILDSTAPPSHQYGVTKKRAREHVAWELAGRIASYPGRALVVLGARTEEDVALLYEVLEDSPVTDLKMIIVAPGCDEAIGRPDNVGVESCLWTKTEEEFFDALSGSGAPSFRDLPEWGVRCGNRTLTLSARDVQKVEKRFALIRERDLRPPDTPSIDDLHRFLNGDLSTWSGYSLGLAVERDYTSESGKKLTQEVEDALNQITDESDSLRTFSIHIPCEVGSGATTMLRHTAFSIAKKGYPTLVLRPDQVAIDREGLLSFATTLGEALTKSGFKGSLPLVVVLDVDHESIPDASLVAESLASHGRGAVVLQGISYHENETRGELRRRRMARLKPLLASASRTDVENCAKTFADVAEKHQFPISVPDLNEWKSYAGATSMKGPSGDVESETLFWIALRFFLIEGMEFTEAEKASDSLGNWIRRRCDEIHDSGMLEVVRYIASLSAFRLVSPLWTVLRPVTGGSFDSSIVSTLRQLRGVVDWGATSDELDDQVLRFLHPTLAAEFLRQHGVRSDRDKIGVLSPVLSSLSAGHSGDIWVAQTLAANVLAPTFEQRLQNVDFDWRLNAFDAMPPALCDQSKAILHHWARCLYQSVDERRAPSVDPSVKRERIELAIQKLTRATELPRREGRDEHPSHLYNTLGTAYANYAKHLAETSHTPSQVNQAWEDACRAFRQSIELLPNIEALLAFSHRLLLRTNVVGGGDTELTPDTVQQVSEALSLLDEAEELLSDHPNPQEEWSVYLHKDRSDALAWLSTDLAHKYIADLRNTERPDLAYYCESRLGLGSGDTPEQVESALQILESADPAAGMRTAMLVLFHLSLLRRHSSRQFDFDLQQTLYQQLEQTEGYSPRHIDRFRHAVMCYQTGEFGEGRERFRRLREDYRKSDGPQFSAKDIWRDPQDPSMPKVTQVRVTRIVTEWRADGYVEELRQDVPLRPRHFTPMPRVNSPESCVIRFGPNGPLAVPPRFEGL